MTQLTTGRIADRKLTSSIESRYNPLVRATDNTVTNVAATMRAHLNATQFISSDGIKYRTQTDLMNALISPVLSIVSDESPLETVIPSTTKKALMSSAKNSIRVVYVTGPQNGMLNVKYKLSSIFIESMIFNRRFCSSRAQYLWRRHKLCRNSFDFASDLARRYSCQKVRKPMMMMHKPIVYSRNADMM